MFNLMFSNPTLQNRFSAATRSVEEIGGWLLCANEPTTWPARFRWRDVKRALGLDYSPLFIESFILAPNFARDKANNYSVWDFDKASEMVEATAQAHRAYTIHFHTHPSGDPEPSHADIGFAAANCQVFRGCAFFAIVTHYPFRIWSYENRWGTLANPDHGQLKVGEFISWRQKRARALL